jgi:succinate-acetate transporter protein
MKVSFDLSGLKRTKWHDYAMRFLFGGLVTVAAGLIAKKFGPVFGGLFLAFPAIFPASATLVEKHERKQKERAGILHSRRGTQAAALDSLGAA